VQNAVPFLFWFNQMIRFAGRSIVHLCNYKDE